MVNDFYKALARFRVITCSSIMKRSKRSRDQIFRSIDEELTRIHNSIKKGYTLGSIRHDVIDGEYRPYKYFNIALSDINNPLDLRVVIQRDAFKITIDDENINQMSMWCTQWRVTKPKTLEECEDDNFYLRWW